MRENKSLAGLVDIREVNVDKSLPKMARIMDYDRQLKGHKHCKYKNIEIIMQFTKGGPPIEDCLTRLAAKG